MEVSKDPLSTGLDISSLEEDMQHVNNPVVGQSRAINKRAIISFFLTELLKSKFEL